MKPFKHFSLQHNDAMICHGYDEHCVFTVAMTDAATISLQQNQHVLIGIAAGDPHSKFILGESNARKCSIELNLMRNGT